MGVIWRYTFGVDIFEGPVDHIRLYVRLAEIYYDKFKQQLNEMKVLMRINTQEAGAVESEGFNHWRWSRDTRQ